MARHRTMMDHDLAFRQPTKHPHPVLSSKPHKPGADLTSLLGFQPPAAPRKQEAPALRELGPFFSGPVSVNRRHEKRPALHPCRPWEVVIAGSA
jgi:hypothetical protein